MLHWIRYSVYAVLAVIVAVIVAVIAIKGCTFCMSIMCSMCSMCCNCLLCCPRIFLHCCGFTARGVRAPSFASGWQSSIGNVPSGSTFSSLQSFGEGSFLAFSFIISLCSTFWHHIDHNTMNLIHWRVHQDWKYVNECHSYIMQSELMMHEPINVALLSVIPIMIMFDSDASYIVSFLLLRGHFWNLCHILYTAVTWFVSAITDLRAMKSDP